LFPHFPAYRAPADEVGNGTEHDEGAEHARIPNLLRNLARHVARAEPRADTHAAVAETAEQSILKISRHLNHVGETLVDTVGLVY
jgi:hypothetical protein